MNADISRRLNTWKEIGAFFGRDERTVKRWEVERALPIHRVPGGGRPMVYAYTHELSAWLAGAELDDVTAGQIEALTASPPTPAPPIEDAPPHVETVVPDPPKRRPVAIAVFASVAVLILAIAMGGWIILRDTISTAKASQPRDPEAVALFRRASHDWTTRTPAGLHLAVDEFTQAIVRDPAYADAYVGLANCYNLLREYTDMSPEVAYPRAKAAATRAIALDDNLAGGHRALAFEQFWWEWNTKVAEREFQRALALDPNSATTHHWYANVLLERGRFDQALKEADLAQALDPTDTSILADRGLILSDAGHPEDAVQILRGIEQTNPSYLSPHRYLADIDFEQDDLRGYVRELEQGARVMQNPVTLSIAEAAASGLKTGGRAAMLQSMLNAQLKLQAQGAISAFDVAKTYARLGDRPNALKYLTVAKARHDTAFLAAPVDAAFAELRRTSGFQALHANF